MGKEIGVTGKLEVGDIVEVHNALAKVRKYPVTKIEGNKAITNFRIFNRKIYHGKYVYEFGKRAGHPWENVYIVPPK